MPPLQVGVVAAVPCLALNVTYTQTFTIASWIVAAVIFVWMDVCLEECMNNVFFSGNGCMNNVYFCYNNVYFQYND